MASRTSIRGNASEYTTRQLVRDLLPFLRPFRKTLVLASVARALGDVVGLFPHYALAALVTFVGAWRPGVSYTIAYWWLGGWVLASLSKVGFLYFAKTRAHMASEAATLDAKKMGLERLFALDIAWHEGENAGNKLKRIDSGSMAVQRIVRMWINNGIEIAVSSVGVLVLLATVDRLVALIALAFFVIYAPIAIHMRRTSSRAARAVNAKEETMNGLLYESVANVRTAKVLGMPGVLLKVVGAASDAVLTKVRIRLYAYQSMHLVQGFMTTGFKAVTLTYILYGVFHGRFEIGFLVLFNGYFNRLTDIIVEFADLSQEAAYAKHSISRMMEIFRTPVVDPGTRNFPDDWKTISLRNVGYRYAGAVKPGSRRTLSGITFDIRRGERIGIVGLSGAGKSTLFKLLLKELEDHTGKILVDGTPLRDISKSSYYRHAAVVLQETEVFNFTLEENIAIAAGKRKADPSALQRALDIAHVTEFLKRLPDGVKTMIGEKGVKLSGGEKQRLGIARAVFKRPDILFLDEATSHLDLESEERIRDSLHTFFRSVTAVVIAHRLTTIKEMDRIVVMEGGRIIEQGTFDELYRAQGRFHELWEMQKLG